jgi:putative membrane protein
MRMMMMVGSAVFGLSVATLASQTPSTNQPKPTTQAPATAAPQPAERSKSTADEPFVKEVAMGGMAEVELGQLASDKGTNPRVKEFAQQMVTDHGKANDELKSIAGSKNISLPMALDAKHKATKERLAKLTGVAFDRAYINEMVTDHRAAAAAFKRESQSGKDPEIKAFAAKTLPTVEGHMKMVQDIQRELMTTGSRPTGTSGTTPPTTPNGKPDTSSPR